MDYKLSLASSFFMLNCYVVIDSSILDKKFIGIKKRKKNISNDLSFMHLKNFKPGPGYLKL